MAVECPLSIIKSDADGKNHIDGVSERTR